MNTVASGNKSVLVIGTGWALPAKRRAARMIGITLAPPSSFTAWAPAFIPATFQFRLSQSPLAPKSHELRFPIRTGRHRGFACNDCHVALAAPRLVRCTGCHAHSPTRIARQHQRVGPVRERCLHCHRGGRAR